MLRGWCVLSLVTQSNRSAGCAMLEAANKALEDKKGESSKGPKDDTKNPEAKVHSHPASSSLGEEKKVREVTNLNESQKAKATTIELKNEVQGPKDDQSDSSSASDSTSTESRSLAKIDSVIEHLCPTKD